MTDTTDQAPRVFPVALVAEALARVEVCNTEIGDRHESTDIGPFAGVYSRICSPDLLALIDGARRVLNELEEAVLDARFDRDQARRKSCPWCPTMIDGDDEYCGSLACARRAGVEARAEAVL